MVFFVVSGVAAAHYAGQGHTLFGLIKAGLKGSLPGLLVIIGLAMWQGWLVSMDFTVAVLAVGLGGVLAAGLAPLVEMALGYTTHIRLMELASRYRLGRPIIDIIVHHHGAPTEIGAAADQQDLRRGPAGRLRTCTRSPKYSTRSSAAYSTSGWSTPRPRTRLRNAMEILISNRQASQPLDLEALEQRMLRVLRGLDCTEDCELSLVFTDDPGIAVLNQDYLGRVGPTNVLAFPMAEGAFAELTPGFLGDVVVSVDTAWREAGDNGLETGEHLVRLLIHGVLHLLGHDHLQDEEQAQAMEDLTERLLAQSAG